MLSIWNDLFRMEIFSFKSFRYGSNRKTGQVKKFRQMSIDNIAAAGLLHVYFLNFFKGAQVWDFDVLDLNDFFIMKSL